MTFNADGSRTFTYGDHNRMSEFSSPSGTGQYQYNGLGQRAIKSATAGAMGDSVLFVYDESGRVLAELNLNAGSQMTREYVYADDMLVAIVEGDQVYYVHTDHLGSPRAVVDQSGVKRWEWLFEANPFGEQPPDEDPENTGSSFTLNLRFPGQYFDAESGLHYNYFRDYEPSTGRYVQSDPIGLDGGNNTYAYVKSRPLNHIDPLGLFSVNGPGSSCEDCEETDKAKIIDAINRECQRARNYIVDPSLRSCIQRRCTSGVVRLFCNCQSSQDRQWGLHHSMFGDTIILCYKWRNLKNSPDGLGRTAIHEWAHSCDWNHGDEGGVPSHG